MVETLLIVGIILFSMAVLVAIVFMVIWFKTSRIQKKYKEVINNGTLEQKKAIAGHPGGYLPKAKGINDETPVTESSSGRIGGAGIGGEGRGLGDGGFRGREFDGRDGEQNKESSRSKPNLIQPYTSPREPDRSEQSIRGISKEVIGEPKRSKQKFKLHKPTDIPTE